MSIPTGASPNAPKPLVVSTSVVADSSKSRRSSASLSRPPSPPPVGAAKAALSINSANVSVSGSASPLQNVSSSVSISGPVATQASAPAANGGSAVQNQSKMKTALLAVGSFMLKGLAGLAALALFSAVVVGIAAGGWTALAVGLAIVLAPHALRIASLALMTPLILAGGGVHKIVDTLPYKVVNFMDKAAIALMYVSIVNIPFAMSASAEYSNREIQAESQRPVALPASLPSSAPPKAAQPALIPKLPKSGLYTPNGPKPPPGYDITHQDRFVADFMKNSGFEARMQKLEGKHYDRPLQRDLMDAVKNMNLHAVYVETQRSSPVKDDPALVAKYEQGVKDQMEAALQALEKAQNLPPPPSPQSAASAAPPPPPHKP